MKAKYICPILTALDEKGEVDMDTMKVMFERLIKANLDGVAIMGSSGEFYAMNMEECKRFAKESIAYLSGRIPVYVGTGRMDINESIELSNYVLDQGADAVMIISPYYIGVDAEGIFSYFDQIADKVKGDIIIYNYPERSGHDVTPAVLKSLLKKHDNFVGIKDSVGSAAHTRELITAVKREHPKFQIYSGFDENMAHVLISGGDGCIGALSNLVPELCGEWVKAFEQEDLIEISSIQCRIDKLMSFYEICTPFMPAMKAALQMVGVPIQSYCKLPALPPNEKQMEKVKEILVEMNLL